MNHIGLRELRSFVYAAELGSLSLAAERLHIVQPAVSRHIQLLEGRLGTKLFHRDGRGMKMTARGRLLLVRASEVLHQVGKIEEEFGERSGANDHQISLAVPYSIDDVLAIGILGLLRSAFPQARVGMTSMPSDAVVTALGSRQVDLGVFACPDGPVPGLTIGRPVEEQFHLIRGRSRDGDPMLTTGLPHALEIPLALSGPSCELRRMVEAAAAACGSPLRVDIEVDRLSVLANVVAAGHAATIAPLHPFKQMLREGRVTATEIIDPGLRRRLVVGAAGARPLGGMIDRLSDLLAKSLSIDAEPVVSLAGTSR